MSRYHVVPIPSRVAILASGGLDSSVLLAELAGKGRHVFPVYIRAGLRWETDELRALRRFLRKLKMKRIEPVAVLRLPMRDLAGDHWSVTGRKVPGYRAALASNYIPGRNLSLLSKAAIFCARNRIGEIALATLGSNPFPDARPQFFGAFARAVELGIGLKLRIRAPFVQLAKSAVVKLGRDLPLRLTVSCARPKGIVHCGKCTKCAERVQAFRKAGIADPTRYSHKPPG